MDLVDFRISEECGFLLETPAVRLPDYFESWDQIASNMVQLIKDQSVRRQIDQIPILEIDKIDYLCDSDFEKYRALRLAHLQLSTMLSGYVWSEGDSKAPKILPKQLAIPLWAVCQKLGGIKPGISHMAAALANYQKIKPEMPLRAWNPSDNMELISFKFVEDYGNNWFFLNTMQLELDFAPGLAAIFNLISKKSHNTIAALNTLTSSIDKMTSTLKRMSLYLNPDVFFYGFRPYLAGFTSGPYLHWGGIIFEGIDSEPKPLSGGSAAQSSIFQCIDGFLGVKHENELGQRDFLLDMREYMPVEHSKIVELSEMYSVRRSVLENLSDLELKNAYNECVDALVNFRNVHIRTVTKYIVCPKNRDRRAESGAQNEETIRNGKKVEENDECFQKSSVRKSCYLERSGSFESLHNLGTGGTGFMAFLKSIRDATVKAKIK